MVELTTEQRLFLKRHKIAVSDVFDAFGLSKTEWYAAMVETGQGFAVRTNPCENGGHTLRTHSGHCIECNTASIAFYRRSRMAGYVYIAGSLSTKRVKVGMTTDLKQREKFLNLYGYGEARDWEMLAYAKTARAGECEFTIHSKLAGYEVSATYVKAGKVYDCYEIFGCSLKVALNALKACLPGDVQAEVPNRERAMLHY
jgi:hypothetical protein